MNNNTFLSVPKDTDTDDFNDVASFIHLKNNYGGPTYSLLGNEEEGQQGKGAGRGREQRCVCDVPNTPGLARLDPGRVGSGAGQQGVCKQWAEMGVGHESMEGAEKESRFLIYYLWALRCMTTRQK